MPQRVVYFTDGNTFGGAEQVLLSLIRGLDRTQWEPWLVHHREPGMHPLVEQVRQLEVPLHEIRRTQGISDVPRWRHLLELVGYLRSVRPAVFHAHLTWPLACKYGLLAAVIARVPAIVATLHCYVNVHLREGLYFQQAIAFGVHRYIGVSDSVADNLRRALRAPRHKVRVIHNGIDIQGFKRRCSDGLRATLTQGTTRRVVLCVARLHSGKGHRFLLRALPHIPDVMLVLAGAGPELGPLRAEARALGVEERTVFLGHRSDVAELLACCDMFVLPSLNEGLPVSVLEAMAACRPVVATNVGGTREAIIDGVNGLLVPPADPASLATAINRFLADTELSRACAAAAYTRVTHEFTTTMMVERNARIYTELLQG